MVFLAVGAFFAGALALAVMEFKRCRVEEILLNSPAGAFFAVEVFLATGFLATVFAAFGAEAVFLAIGFFAAGAAAFLAGGAAAVFFTGAAFFAGAGAAFFGATFSLPVDVLVVAAVFCIDINGCLCTGSMRTHFSGKLHAAADTLGKVEVAFLVPSLDGI